MKNYRSSSSSSSSSSNHRSARVFLHFSASLCGKAFSIASEFDAQALVIASHKNHIVVCGTDNFRELLLHNDEFRAMVTDLFCDGSRNARLHCIQPSQAAAFSDSIPFEKPSWSRDRQTFLECKDEVIAEAYELHSLFQAPVLVLLADHEQNVYTFASELVRPLILDDEPRSLITAALENQPCSPSAAAELDSSYDEPSCDIVQVVAVLPSVPV